MYVSTYSVSFVGVRNAPLGCLDAVFSQFGDLLRFVTEKIFVPARKARTDVGRKTTKEAGLPVQGLDFGAPSTQTIGDLSVRIYCRVPSAAADREIFLVAEITFSRFSEPQQQCETKNHWEQTRESKAKKYFLVSPKTFCL